MSRDSPYEQIAHTTPEKENRNDYVESEDHSAPHVRFLCQFIVRYLLEQAYCLCVPDHAHPLDEATASSIDSRGLLAHSCASRSGASRSINVAGRA
jgi:hypothetical protein